MSIDWRRGEFGDDFAPDPAPDFALNGHRRMWRLTQLAARPWPAGPAEERCDAVGRLILQHRVTGRVRVLAVTCRTWKCPGCGGRRAKEVMDKLGAHWHPETEVWWAWGQGHTQRDRLRQQLLRRHSKGHAWIRRRDTFHLFADAPLTVGRPLTQPEGLLVARFSLRPGVVRVSGPWLNVALEPIYRRLDFASAPAANAARSRAEDSILMNYGVAYSFDEDDPPKGMANAFAAEFIAALEVSRDAPDTTGGTP